MAPDDTNTVNGHQGPTDGAAGSSDADSRRAARRLFARFAVAGLLGQCASSYAFGLALLTIAGVRNTMSGALGETMAPGEIALTFALLPVSVIPVAAASALVMAPWSIVGLTLTWRIVRRGRLSGFGAVATGTVLGCVLAGLAVWSLPGSGEVDRVRFALGDGAGFAATVEASASFAGASYGWVVWRMTIRPRRTSLA